ncbi:MAG TPA: metalloregulator ArsR/SmtB family transcription factor [Acidimicrobiales bacterium]|nr:metalloregulator ArsR/SmtB family transcription factor [Acidimicrobiales bacterium]
MNSDPATDRIAGAAALMKALASPLRLAIVVELQAGARCVHELQAALGAAGRTVSQPLMSQHLKVLRDAGLVVPTRRAQEMAYALVDGRVTNLVDDAMRAGLAGAR